LCCGNQLRPLQRLSINDNWLNPKKGVLGKMSDLGKIESVIGPSLIVKGEIQSSGTLRIDGVVEGSITSKGTVLIANDGVVKADIKADHVVIGGKIHGNVTARERVEILPTGNLNGDITTVAYGLVVSEGAIFEGAVKMNRESVSPKVPQKK
jgi:cytoskeletal protein CcmA (bactofilin family)